MSLIICPDCKGHVSDRAATCPKCGYPIAGGGRTEAQGGKVQTIEKTSKRIKIRQLCAFILIAAGGVCMILGAACEDVVGAMLAIGIVGIAGGLIWLGIMDLLTWWHHG